MAFSSDNPLYANQLSISMDLPDINDPDYNDVLEQGFKRTANSVNSKVGGLLLPEELNSFKQLYKRADPQQTRSVYRITLDLVGLNGGNIGGGATVSFNHDITGLANAVSVTAACTSTIPEYFSVEYPSVKLTSTQVVFTNPSGAPLTQADVIAEYTKETA